MTSSWECASSWSASNRRATRASAPLGSPGRRQRPTSRRSTPVFTGNWWLSTASVFLRSGSCGTSCTTPNWAATTGPARQPGPSSGRGGWERAGRRWRTTVRSRCSSRISDSLQGWAGSARPWDDNVVIKEDLWPARKARDVFKSTVESCETVSKLADHLWGNELARAKCLRFFRKEAQQEFSAAAMWAHLCDHTVFANSDKTLVCREGCVMSSVSLRLLNLQNVLCYCLHRDTIRSTRTA